MYLSIHNVYLYWQHQLILKIWLKNYAPSCNSNAPRIKHGRVS